MANPTQIKKYLKGVDFPITKPELIQKAEENGADKLSLQVLTRIAGQRFDEITEVNEAISNVNLEK